MIVDSVLSWSVFAERYFDPFYTAQEFRRRLLGGSKHLSLASTFLLSVTSLFLYVRSSHFLILSLVGGHRGPSRVPLSKET